MTLAKSSIPLNSICEGCLSIDRKLSEIKDDNCKTFFSHILDPLESINHPLQLCWECVTIIQKTLKFRKQVRQAHELLVQFLSHNATHLPVFSKLKLCEAHTQDEISDFNNIVYKKDIVNTSDIKNLYCNEQFDTIDEQVDAVKEQISMNNEQIGNSNEQTGNAPLTFIKVEDNDTNLSGDDNEAFFVGGDSNDNEDVKKSAQDLKAELKSDPFKYELPVAKVKVEKKTREKVLVDDFDESDEEPLEVKKQRDVEDKKEFKPRGRRKMEDKDDNIVITLDKRKHPAPKQEKPPGVINNVRVARKLQQLNVASGQLEMVVLSWEEVQEERERALTSEAFTRHDYRCYDCVLGFNHRVKLENHMKKHDQSSGTAMCSVCRVVCRDTHSLCAHKRRHRVRWRCMECGAAWSRAAVAADHYARAHAAPAPTHTCSTCGHTEPTLGKLRNHIKNHSERQKCELCEKTFRDKTSLRTHLFIHKGEKDYACPRCDKRFLFKKAMEVHLVTHEAPAQLYCYQCDMNFKNRMSYYQHMKYNLKHIDPAKLKYACNLCDKKFVKAARLQEHNVAVHLKVTPIQCTMAGCKFACSSRSVLRTHIRMVHRNVRARRDHVCDTCGKAYTTKKSLEGHIRSHTGERPFHCTQCPATFGYEAALYNHNKLVHLKAKTGRQRLLPTAAAAPKPPPWSLD